MSKQTLITAAGVLTALLSAAPAAAQTGSTNLLENPSFEAPYEPDLRADGGGYVANGWSAWWYNDAGDDFDAPEFKQANSSLDPNRVRSGVDAQQLFRPWARHMAGVYQQVQVPENAALRFNAYGHAWSTNADPPNPRDSTDKGETGEMMMRIGIDPTGGTDPFSPGIVWSGISQVYDNYALFSVEAQAQGSQVTVFTYSSPRWPWATNNVYWDDASLIVTEEGSGTGGSLTSGTPGAERDLSVFLEGVTPAAVQAAEADGVQYHTVQAGETILQIAAAYSIDPNALIEKNELTSENIFSGQRLLIWAAGENSAAADDATQTPAAEAAEATRPPQRAQGGQICLTLFDDADGDGLWGRGEVLIAGGLLALSGQAEDEMATEADQAAHCFADLAPGDYLISAEVPAGYQLSGPSQVPVRLEGAGSEVAFSFPARSAGTPADQAADQPAEARPAQSGRVPGPLILGSVFVAMMAAGGGLLAYFLIIRRAQKLD